MTTFVVAIVALVAGGVMAVTFLAGACLRPARKLSDVEQQVAWLRREVIDYRVAHEYFSVLLDRRLEALEETAARAVNEVRMAAAQLVGRVPADEFCTGDRDSSDG